MELEIVREIGSNFSYSEDCSRRNVLVCFPYAIPGVSKHATLTVSNCRINVDEDLDVRTPATLITVVLRVEEMSRSPATLRGKYASGFDRLPMLGISTVGKNRWQLGGIDVRGWSSEVVGFSSMAVNPGDIVTCGGRNLVRVARPELESIFAVVLDFPLDVFITNVKM